MKKDQNNKNPKLPEELSMDALDKINGGTYYDEKTHSAVKVAKDGLLGSSLKDKEGKSGS